MIVDYMRDVDKSKIKEDMHQLYEFQYMDKMDLGKNDVILLKTNKLNTYIVLIFHFPQDNLLTKIMEVHML